jgi:hypothetical protein
MLDPDEGEFCKRLLKQSPDSIILPFRDGDMDACLYFIRLLETGIIKPAHSIRSNFSIRIRTVNFEIDEDAKDLLQDGFDRFQSTMPEIAVFNNRLNQARLFKSLKLSQYEAYRFHMHENISGTWFLELLCSDCSCNDIHDDFLETLIQHVAEVKQHFFKHPLQAHMRDSFSKFEVPEWATN